MEVLGCLDLAQLDLPKSDHHGSLVKLGRPSWAIAASGQALGVKASAAHVSVDLLPSLLDDDSESSGIGCGLKTSDSLEDVVFSEVLGDGSDVLSALLRICTLDASKSAGHELAGVATEKGVGFEVDEESAMIGRDDEVVRSVPDSDNGLCECLSAEGVVQPLASSRIGFEFSFDAVVVRHKIQEVVLLYQIVETVVGVADSLVEVAGQ